MSIRLSCLQFLTLLAVIFITHIHAQSPNPSFISSDSLNKSVYVGNAVYRVGQERKYEMALYAAYINEIVEDHPNISTKQIIKEVERVRGEQAKLKQEAAGNYKVSSAYIDAANYFLDILGEVPNKYSKDAAKVTKELLDWGVKGYESLERDEVQMQAMDKLFHQQQKIAEFQEQEWGALYDNARGRESVKRAIDYLFGEFLNASINDDAKTLYHKNQDFQTNGMIRSIINRIDDNGDVSIPLTDLKSLASKQFDSLISQTTIIRKGLDSINSKQESLYDAYLRSEGSSGQAVREQLELKAAQSSVFIVSTLAGFLNKTTGQQINVLGNSALQTYNAIKEYSKNIELGSKGIGAVLLTGDLLQVGLGLLSLFSPGGPSPEQIILDQLGKIKEQIEDLRNEMDSRFNKIDLTLSSIWKSMDESFAIIFNGQIENREALYSIQQGILDLHSRLDKIEGEVIASLQNASNIQMVNEINFCLYGVNVQPSDFNRCASDLRTYCTQHIFKAPEVISGSADPGSESFRSDELYSKFSRSLPTYINAFVSYVNNKINSNAETKNLPNYSSLIFGANAYLDLILSKWDSYSKNIPSQYTSDILNISTHFNKALLKFISQDSGRLIKRLFREYEKTASLLINQILSEKQKFERDSAYGVDIWGSLDTNLRREDPLPLYHAPDILTHFYNAGDVSDAGGRTFSFPLTNFRLIDPIYRLAHRMRLHDLDFCWNTITALDTRLLYHYEFQLYGIQNGLPVFARRLDVYNFPGYTNMYDNIVIKNDSFTKASDERLFLDTYADHIRTVPVAVFHLINNHPDDTTMLQPDFVYFFLKFRNNLDFITDSSTKEKYQRIKTKAANTHDPDLDFWSKPFYRDVVSKDALDVKTYRDALSLEIESKLTGYRAAFKRKIIRELKSESELQKTADELSLLKKTMESVLVLGYQSVLDSNDVLRALFYGEASLLDRPNILSFLEKKNIPEDRLRQLPEFLNKQVTVFETLLAKNTADQKSIMIDKTLQSVSVRLKALSQMQKQREKAKRKRFLFFE